MDIITPMCDVQIGKYDIVIRFMGECSSNTPYLDYCKGPNFNHFTHGKQNIPDQKSNL